MIIITLHSDNSVNEGAIKFFIVRTTTQIVIVFYGASKPISKCERCTHSLITLILGYKKINKMLS